jgi:hypothetical protein
MAGLYQFRYHRSYLVAIAIILAVAAILVATAGCQLQGSWTPKPTCPSGQHAVHAKSHQGHVWDCVNG